MTILEATLLTGRKQARVALQAIPIPIPGPQNPKVVPDDSLIHKKKCTMVLTGIYFSLNSKLTNLINTATLSSFPAFYY